LIVSLEVPLGEDAANQDAQFIINNQQTENVNVDVQSTNQNLNIIEITNPDELQRIASNEQLQNQEVEVGIVEENAGLKPTEPVSEETRTERRLSIVEITNQDDELNNADAASIRGIVDDNVSLKVVDNDFVLVSETEVADMPANEIQEQQVVEEPSSKSAADLLIGFAKLQTEVLAEQNEQNSQEESSNAAADVLVGFAKLQTQLEETQAEVESQLKNAQIEVEDAIKDNLVEEQQEQEQQQQVVDLLVGFAKVNAEVEAVSQNEQN
jgi:hypothetical protein